MVNSSVVKYVRKNLKRGISKDRIKEEMLKADYDEKTIEDAFNHVDSMQEIGNKKFLIIIVGIIALVAIFTFLQFSNKEEVQPIVIEENSNKEEVQPVVIGENNLINTFYTELYNEVALLSTNGYVNLFLEECSEFDVIQEDDNVKCSAFVLQIINFKLELYAAQMGEDYIFDEADETKLNQLLLNSKDQLLSGKDFSVDSSKERSIIYSLKYHNLINDEELDILSDKFFINFDEKYLEESKCHSLWNQVFYLYEIYGFSTLNQVKESKPEYVELLEPACAEIAEVEYDEFCTDVIGSTDKTTYVCNYHKYLNLKYFCDAFSEQDVEATNTFIEAHPNLSPEESTCLDMIRYMVSS